VPPSPATPSTACGRATPRSKTASRRFATASHAAQCRCPLSPRPLHPCRVLSCLCVQLTATGFQAVTPAIHTSHYLLPCASVDFSYSDTFKAFMVACDGTAPCGVCVCVGERERERERERLR
jgi:hypothetical protein